MTLVPVISDIQVPLHDRRSVDAIATFLADYDLDSVCVGDAIDAPQVSKWARGMSGEYDGQLHKAREATVQVLSDLRVRGLSRSNHDLRIENYVAQHAPGLDSLPELKLEQFLRLSEIGCDYYRDPYQVAPGWLMMHGDEGSSIQSPGGTALNLAQRVGSSVVCGHTHKMGLQHKHASHSGRVRRELWGFEVGNLMDQKKASYLRAGHANWTHGFGILVVDGKDVTPVALPIRNGRFSFDGRVWKA